MGKRKLIEKLIKASGGWEKFLYQTLKDLHTEMETGVGDFFEAEDALDEAKTVIDAYEEEIRRNTGEPDCESVQPNQVISTPQVQKVVDDTEDKKEKHPVRVTPVIKTLKTESVEVDDIVEIKLEDLKLTLAPRTPAKSRRLARKVGVDSDAGECQGVLQIPSNHKLVNRRSIIITTEGNFELGRVIDKSGLEGQITGQGVSGFISMSGKYKLVFKKADLGIGLIHYDIMAIPPKMNKNQFEKALALQNGSTVESLQASLQSFEKVIIPCQCGKEDCHNWRVVDKAAIEEAEAQRKERLLAIRNTNTVGEVK